MADDLYTLSEAAFLLAVRPYRIVYLITTGQVPEPRLRIGGRRVFSKEEIRRIGQKLLEKIEKQEKKKGKPNGKFRDDETTRCGNRHDEPSSRQMSEENWLEVK